MLIGTIPNNPFKPVSTVPRVAASNSLCALSWGDVEAYCYWKHVVMATMNNMSQGRMARKQMMKVVTKMAGAGPAASKQGSARVMAAGSGAPSPA